MSESQVNRADITPVCRQSRGDDGAFDEAVRRLRADYDRVCAGWAGHDQQPTLHLVLKMTRPPQTPGS